MLSQGSSDSEPKGACSNPSIRANAGVGSLWGHVNPVLLVYLGELCQLIFQIYKVLHCTPVHSCRCTHFNVVVHICTVSAMTQDKVDLMLPALEVQAGGT